MNTNPSDLLESIIVMDSVPFRFGEGATQEIGYELRKRGIHKALLVTDPHLQSIGMVDPVETLIGEADVDVEVYADSGVEPTDQSFEQALAFQKGKTFDAYIALGGGSSIDTAKAMNLYGTYPAPLLDYINKPIGKAKPVTGPLKPLIAIPTTAGTGSESTSVAVLDMLDLKVKTGISQPAIRPTAAIIDPLNTISMPPYITAATGLDVLCHALESYISKPYNRRPRPITPEARATFLGANPVADIFAEKAITLSGQYLRRAFFNSHDLEARTNMMLAATFAGIGLGSAGAHIPHAMGYPVAGMVRDFRMPDYPVEGPLVPHGISVIINAPATFRWTYAAWPERHLKAAEMLGEDTRGIPLNDGADALPTALIKLMRDLNLPNGLEAVGYNHKDIPALVEGTIKQQRLLIHSPRPANEKDLEAIFQDGMRYW
ncbi:MAG: hydroxyacid-oxoacid transhydrogenase [Chloroflexota bacterium]